MPNMPRGVEENWERALRNLEQLMAQYEASQEVSDELVQRVVQALRLLSEIHPDPRVRNHFRGRAEAFASGNAKDRKHILADVGKGVLILLATPFALVGAVLFAAGTIVYGAGMFVKGVGSLLTGGMFR
jgi:hypothetical protein